MRALIRHQAQARRKTLCMMKPQRVYLMQRMNSRGMSSAWGTCLRACAGLCKRHHKPRHGALVPLSDHLGTPHHAPASMYAAGLPEPFAPHV